MYREVRKNTIKIIVILSIAIFFLSGISSAEKIGLDFNVPGPPAGEEIDTTSFTFGGGQIQAIAYESPKNQYEIAMYYDNFFKEKGFRKLLDGDVLEEEMQKIKSGGQDLRGLLGGKMPEIDIRKIRFKKDELVIDVMLSSKKQTVTDVIIAKHLQPAGAPSLEERKLSIYDDTFVRLPKEDLAGEDLRIIPRPPESIRWNRIDRGRQTILSYASPLSVDELSGFYRRNMPYQAWELQEEMSTGDMAVDYQKATGGKKLNFTSPFADGENLNKIVDDGSFLDFKGRFGSARIMIFPNFIDRKEGSVIQIIYKEEDKR